MKKLLAVVAMLMVASMSYAGSEGSCSILSKFYVEPLAEAVIPFESGWDIGVYAGGKVGYQIKPWLAVEAESGWAQVKRSDESDTFTMIPVLLNVRVNVFPGKWIVDPYLYVGAGGVGFDNNSVDGMTTSGDDIGQIGLGAAYRINPNLSINLDMKFLFIEPSWQINDISGTENLNSYLVGGSATWRF